MYATVRQLKIKKAFREENARLVEEDLLPQARTIPGFVDYYLVYTDNETEISIGVFQDKKGAERFNEAANKFVREKLSGNVRLSTIHEGSVAVQSRAPAIA